MKEAYTHSFKNLSLIITFIIIGVTNFTIFAQGERIPGNIADQNKTIADSIMQAISDSDDDEKINTLLNQSRYFSIRNPELSLDLANLAHGMALKNGDPMLKSNTLNGLAVAYFYLGNNTEAIKLILESIGYISDELKNNPDSVILVRTLLKMYSNAGNIYQAMGELDKSLDMLLNAHSMADQLLETQPGNTDFMKSWIRVSNNLAVVYWTLGEIDRANDLLQLSLTSSRKIEDKQSIIITLNNTGLIQIEEGLLEEAAHSYREALELEKQVNDSLGISGNYNNMGLVMEKLGDNRMALSYYLSSLQITRRLGYSIGISNTCSNVGKIYSEINQPDSALYFVRLGIDEARKAGNKTYLLKNYEILYTVFERLGQYNNALEAHKNYLTIKDSIFNSEKSRQIAEMEARFENEKKEKENHILRQNIKIHQRTSLLLVVSLVALFIITLLLFYFYRLKNKALIQKTLIYAQGSRLQMLEKARLEDQLFAEQQINKLQNEKLEHQNRELSTRILSAINKNDTMNNILNELEEIKVNGDGIYDNCYKKINQLVKENLSTDKEWDQFKLHFEEVNPGFFFNLMEKYPELTQNELKMCAYYRINLNTKEIAKMLSVTPAAIQKSRHRLRKKMNIPSETELPEFMSRF